MAKVSQRERIGLRFINDYCRDNWMGPSIREIQKAVGYKSSSTALYLVRSLAYKGLITFEAKKNHSIQPASAEVPILGYIEAGEIIWQVERQNCLKSS